jgi:DNA-binding MarR family transcriptional regulator
MRSVRPIIRNNQLGSEKTTELSKYASESTPAGNLSASEISLIILIGQYNNIKVTDLAIRYGATKGAISTMVKNLVKNLVKKGLVKKCRSPESEREVLLSLTELGIAVFEEKEIHSQNLYKDIDAHLQILTLEQKSSLFNMLQTLEEHIDEHIEEHLGEYK